jgi:hypothetical protein
MQLRYFVPFKAQEGVSTEYALKQKLLNIEGEAVDTSVNLNKWQVPEEDLDFFVSTLIGAQLRIDHAESAMAVIGKVPEGKRLGNTAWFRAEIGELPIIEKVLRGYLTHVSVQVDSDDVECSKCKRSTRKEGMLVHLCPGAWEIVHKPKVRELSIVASPAYKNTKFAPVGFAAAMDESQKIDFPCNSCNHCSQLLKGNEDVGSRLRPQEPENKKKDETKEVKPLSAQDEQAKASPHQAQGAINVAPGESAPKQHTYEEYINQLTQLKKQMGVSSEGLSDAEIDDLNKRVADLEGELAKRAKKAELGKKIAELSKKLAEPEGEAEEGEAEGAEAEAEAEAEEGEAEAEEGKRSEAKKRASGQGIVALDEVQKDALGNYDWFKDLLKAHKKLMAFK